MEFDLNKASWYGKSAKMEKVNFDDARLLICKREAGNFDDACSFISSCDSEAVDLRTDLFSNFSLSSSP